MKYGPFIAFVAALTFFGRVPSRASIDVAFLAADLHFAIGGHHIVIPVVAYSRSGVVFDLHGRKPPDITDELRAARDPAQPMRKEKIDLSIRQYQSTGENLASLGICPLLARKWSAALCRGQHRGLLTRLPTRFSVIDRARAGVLRDHWTVGRERVYDQIKDMTFQSDETEIGCDRQSRFCTAAVEALPGLLAVWSVAPDDVHGVTAKQVAEIQGAAIVQFVRRGIGPTEDTSLISAE